MLKRDEQTYSGLVEISEGFLRTDWFVNALRGNTFFDDKGVAWFVEEALISALRDYLVEATRDDLNRLYDLCLLEKTSQGRLEMGQHRIYTYYRLLDPVEIVRKRGEKKQD